MATCNAYEPASRKTQTSHSQTVEQLIAHQVRDHAQGGVKFVIALAGIGEEVEAVAEMATAETENLDVMRSWFVRVVLFEIRNILCRC